jgi:hypothetical protein
MKMCLAGLKFIIGGHLHMNVLPGVGSRCHSFFLCFAGFDLNDVPHYFKRNKNPGLCVRLDHGVKFLFFLMESPLIGGSVEGQHEINSQAWSGKKTDGLASPSDCHKTAKMMSYEDASKTTYIPASCSFRIWSQMFIRADLNLQLQC